MKGYRVGQQCADLGRENRDRDTGTIYGLEWEHGMDIAQNNADSMEWPLLGIWRLQCESVKSDHLIGVGRVSVPGLNEAN